VVCTAPYTTTQTKNQQTRASCQPNGWSQQSNVFAMPVQNDILPCVKDKDIQPYTLYEAMPVSLH
jgi:hypothetical protein